MRPATALRRAQQSRTVVGADVRCGSHLASSRGSGTGLAPPSGETLFTASSSERRLAFELCRIDWASLLERGRRLRTLAALGVAGRVGAPTERRGRRSRGARERAGLSPLWEAGERTGARRGPRVARASARPGARGLPARSSRRRRGCCGAQVIESSREWRANLAPSRAWVGASRRPRRRGRQAAASWLD